ncbi:hypothetical protein [Amycolatopsis thermophila]|uniref:PE family protein n=1 Tax=Amycolatopsis thermophila TaxID=206084 RepID=A0ABU0EV31_9PSEU|nr:hypothetical protein [Amycolatopsis thermophila]MDQ0378999.1 hypothetical protein [Amycolatopsis thermophila]
MTEGNRATPIGPTVGAGLSSVGGAGYRFDPEQIEALIPKWEELRDGLDDDQLQLQMAAQVTAAPSADAPAQNNARQISASIRAAIEHNANLRNYAQLWIDTLRKANGTYREQDDTALKGLYGAPDTPDGSGLYQ